MLHTVCLNILCFVAYYLSSLLKLFASSKVIMIAKYRRKFATVVSNHRCRWSSLWVTQPSNSHHLILCLRACVPLAAAFVLCMFCHESP